MVLRMYDHSVRYDFSKGAKPNTSVRTTTTNPTITNNNNNSHGRRTTPTSSSSLSTSERSLSWRDGDTTVSSRRHFHSSSQRGGGFNVPPPYAPYVPTDADITPITTSTISMSTPSHRRDHLEVSAPSPFLEERMRVHQAWFARRRSRREDTATSNQMILQEPNPSWNLIVHVLAQLLPMLQFIATFHVWWNQWLEFRLKLTAKRRIAQALLNLRAAWAWNEQHMVLVTANDRDATSHDEPTTTTPVTVVQPWSLREVVGDVGMALFSPLHEEAFVPFPVLPPSMTEYVAPPSTVTRRSWTNAEVESRQQEAGESPTCDDSSTRKTEPEINWEVLAMEDEAAITSELEDDVEEDMDNEMLLEEYPVEVVPEDPAELKDCPRILTDDFLQQLVDDGLPDELKMNKWQRVFAIGRDGDNFLTMVEYSARFRYTLVAMKTTTGHVLGGFASERWNSPPQSSGSGSSYHNRRQSYYGTGQSFLFTTHPDVVAQQQEEKLPLRRSGRSRSSITSQPTTKPLVAIFKWTGANEYCQICDVDKGTLAMGGGGAFGLIVQDDFNRGVTSSCFTFGNPCLVPGDNDGRFEIESFEVYGLIPWLTESSISSSCGSSVLLSSSPPHVSPGRRSSSSLSLH